MKKILFATILALSPSIIYAQNIADEEVRIRARFKSANKEFEKLVRESLNGVMLLYEKRPELFPGVAPNVKFPTRWMDVLEVESLVRHTAEMRRKADIQLESLATRTKEKDKLAALDRAEEAIGAIESNTEGIIGILNELYLPEHRSVLAWRRAATRDDQNNTAPHEKRLDFLLKTSVNVAAYLIDLAPEEIGNENDLNECGRLYFAPYLESYALTKAVLAKREDIGKNEKRELAKKIADSFTTAADGIEFRLRSIYHGVHISETIRTWLREGIKK